jgi:hypothetical protein
MRVYFCEDIQKSESNTPSKIYFLVENPTQQIRNLGNDFTTVTVMPSTSIYRSQVSVAPLEYRRVKENRGGNGSWTSVVTTIHQAERMV